MTYTALASLVILGDDLSHVNRPAVLRGVRELQLPSGRCVQGGHSHDLPQFRNQLLTIILP